jgi:hypothetical protein
VREIEKSENIEVFTLFEIPHPEPLSRGERGKICK